MNDLTVLRQELETVLAEQKWMREILALQGVVGPWLTPNETARVTGRGRDAIMRDINTAEEKRALEQKWPLKYAVGYRNDGDPSKGNNTWKINLPEYQKFIAIPPDQLGV